MTHRQTKNRQAEGTYRQAGRQTERQERKVIQTDIQKGRSLRQTDRRVLQGQLQYVPVTAEQRAFGGRAVLGLEFWSHGVNDEPGRQVEALGHLDLARTATCRGQTQRTVYDYVRSSILSMMMMTL